MVEEFLKCIADAFVKIQKKLEVCDQNNQVLKEIQEKLVKFEKEQNKSKESLLEIAYANDLHLFKSSSEEKSLPKHKKKTSNVLKNKTNIKETLKNNTTVREFAKSHMFQMYENETNDQ